MNNTSTGAVVKGKAPPEKVIPLFNLPLRSIGGIEKLDPFCQ